MRRHTDWLAYRETDGHKQERKSKIPTLVSMLVPQILSICIIHYIWRASPERAHFCQLIQDKTIIMKNFNKNNNNNSTSITFICQCQFSFYLFIYFFWKNRKHEKWFSLISRILPLISSQSYWRNNHNNKKNLSCWRGCFVPKPDTKASPMIFLKEFLSILICIPDVINSSPETRVTYKSWATQ